MQLFARVFYAALIAGIVAGLTMTAVQALRAWPLIHSAETYERAAAAHHHHDGDAAEAAEWEPADGIERAAFTALANVLAGIGFALLLTGAYALRGSAVGWRRGLLWGAAGFATFALMPSLGLPPELPGSDAAPLIDRQIWWLATAMATGTGLWLVAFLPEWRWKAAGLLVIALPHIVGAPGEGHNALVPADMSREFVLVSLGASLVFWMVLGLATAVAFGRLVPLRR